MLCILSYTWFAVLILPFSINSANSKLCRSHLNADSYRNTTVDGNSLFLNDVYTDAFSTSKKTADVYANDKMQACIFVSVTYEGDDATKDEVRDFVRKNVKIYELTQSGEKVPLDWANSSSSNGFLHDFSSGVSLKPFESNTSALEFRVPFYFTVPIEASDGIHRWVAGYNGEYTSVQDPVQVTCHSFSVTRDDFEFVHFGNSIVSLKYKDSSVPEYVKLHRCAKCDEIDPRAFMAKEDSPPEYGKYKEVYVYYQGVWAAVVSANFVIVHLEDLTQHDIEDDVRIASGTESSITSAFAQGIALCDDVPKYSIQILQRCTKWMTPFKLEDNCGNYVNAYLIHNDQGQFVVYRVEMTY